MDFIHIIYPDRDDVLTLAANFGVDCPRVGDYLTLPERPKEVVVRKVVRNYRPEPIRRGTSDSEFVLCERHIHTEIVGY